MTRLPRTRPRFVPSETDPVPLEKVAASISLGDPVRVLTVAQPWASLLQAGLKRYEVRNFSTRYRGWILLRAAKTVVPLWTHPRKSLALEALEGAGVREPLPMGAILGVFWLRDCAPTRHARLDFRSKLYVSDPALWVTALPERERQLGDFSVGSGFDLRRVAGLAVPIPFTSKVALGPCPRALRLEVALALRPLEKAQAQT